MFCYAVVLVVVVVVVVFAGKISISHLADAFRATLARVLSMYLTVSRSAFSLGQRRPSGSLKRDWVRTTHNHRWFVCVCVCVCVCYLRLLAAHWRRSNRFSSRRRCGLARLCGRVRVVFFCLFFLGGWGVLVFLVFFWFFLVFSFALCQRLCKRLGLTDGLSIDNQVIEQCKWVIALP